MQRIHNEDSLAAFVHNQSYQFTFTFMWLKGRRMWTSDSCTAPVNSNVLVKSKFASKKMFISGRKEDKAKLESFMGY